MRHGRYDIIASVGDTKHLHADALGLLGGVHAANRNKRGKREA